MIRRYRSRLLVPFLLRTPPAKKRPPRQAAGLIRYARGHIKVLDRAGLEQRTCECYAVVRKEYERLLPVASPE